MIQYPRTLKNNIYHSNKREPPLFCHLYTNTWPHSAPYCWQNPCSGCNSGTDWLFGLIDWLLFLNTFSFDFVSTPNKSLRFTRFRRSYVNHTAVVRKKHCRSYTAFLPDVCCSKRSSSFFFQLFVPNDSAFSQAIFVEHTCCLHVANSMIGKQTRRCEIVIHKYTKTSTWS